MHNDRTEAFGHVLHICADTTFQLRIPLAYDLAAYIA